jgi:hypothetical protein
MHGLIRSLTVLSAALVVAGCSGSPARLQPPSVPATAAADAIAKYDRDGDQSLSGAELDSVPAIKSALRRIDLDDDGKVTESELAARFRHWVDSKVGLKQVGVKIVLKGRPLSDANIRLIPLEFLGPEVKPAQGTTSTGGSTQLEISSAQHERGVQCGFFRVEVSKQSNGRELLAAKYNVDSELGIEVSDDNPTVDNWKLNLD